MEGKNDFNNAYKILQCDEYNDCIVQVTHLGKKVLADGIEHKSGNRPLRVELKSKHDRDWVLQNAKYLAKDAKSSFKDIKIVKCLGQSERESLKDVRMECVKLNNSVQKTVSGKEEKEKYFVLNCRIMERLSNGKMVPFKRKSIGGSAIDNSSSSNENNKHNQPKQSQPVTDNSKN